MEPQDVARGAQPVWGARGLSATRQDQAQERACLRGQPATTGNQSFPWLGTNDRGPMHGDSIGLAGRGRGPNTGASQSSKGKRGKHVVPAKGRVQASTSNGSTSKEPAAVGGSGLGTSTAGGALSRWGVLARDRPWWAQGWIRRQHRAVFQ